MCLSLLFVRWRWSFILLLLYAIAYTPFSASESLRFRKMARELKIVVRVTEREKAKVQAFADKLGVSVSEVVQDWIKSLPDPITHGG
ncbi:hypothetical protein G7B40_000740 [Aetokthonos hydrillicola Thurmond2011]|uniref:Uncharacterized protein n=1 Tax=Aetokthonos hydrillicola Thurmond2011 TaxID=2712845 RepID=A0AAP5I3K1_9CYAN|nr:hypothetical protein [Aetokthonos hydrillicola CCALA 1050]MBW4588204.1 hypothetical protein [Aetokthonos hydrillicola CCALA 1050]MDR9893112.1 hypothetical protein [Aetokthonos hydrillicola Thurmond2011]